MGSDFFSALTLHLVQRAVCSKFQVCRHLLRLTVQKCKFVEDMPLKMCKISSLNMSEPCFNKAEKHFFAISSVAGFVDPLFQRATDRNYK